MFEKIRDILAEQLNVSKDKITLETDIQADLKADSLNVVELLFALEEEFKITVPDEDAAKLKLVKDLVAFVEKAKK